MKTVQLIIECTGDDDKEKKISELGSVKYHLPMINSYVLEIPEAALPKLQAMKQVKAVHEPARITAQMNSARKTIHAEKPQQNGLTGRGVTIAILDTGASLVEDFTVPRNRIVAFKDIVNGRMKCYDDNGHGTHVPCPYY